MGPPRPGTRTGETREPGTMMIITTVRGRVANFVETIPIWSKIVQICSASNVRTRDTLLKIIQQPTSIHWPDLHPPDVSRSTSNIPRPGPGHYILSGDRPPAQQLHRVSGQPPASPGLHVRQDDGHAGTTLS